MKILLYTFVTYVTRELAKSRDEQLYCTTSFSQDTKQVLCRVTATCSVYARLCVYALISQYYRGFGERKDEPLWWTKHVMSEFPPSLPTTTKPRRPERLHREGTTKSKRIIYTSHTKKGREKEKEREGKNGATNSLRSEREERMRERRRQEGHDPTSKLASRVHGNECSPCDPMQSLYEETALNENREGSRILSLCLSRAP